MSTVQKCSQSVEVDTKQTTLVCSSLCDNTLTSFGDSKTFKKKKVKERTSVVLLQSGLNESWWADSMECHTYLRNMECYTYLRNVTDLWSDGKTPYERRFGQPVKGPIIPFGSLVEYHPIIAKEQSIIHQFGKKVLPGLFLGYALYAG